MLRLQIDIKLTRSNDGEGRKHPLKYLCLKCRIWLEINKTNFLSGVYCSVSVLLIYVWHHSCFSLFSCDPDGPISLCIHKSYLKHRPFDFMLIGHFSWTFLFVLFVVILEGPGRLLQQKSFCPWFQIIVSTDSLDCKVCEL